MLDKSVRVPLSLYPSSVLRKACSSLHTSSKNMIFYIFSDATDFTIYYVDPK